jgi:hypothetical protein
VTPRLWTPEAKSLGQSLTTALVVQEFLGGIIYRSKVGKSYHFWNVLPGDELVDLTEDEFSEEEYLSAGPSVPMRREVLLDDNLVQRRYSILISSILDALAKNTEITR